MLVSLAKNRAANLAFVVVIAWHLAVYFWPVSWWVEHGQIRVLDGVAGKDFRMVVDRQVNRPHRATWTVSIHKHDGSSASWSVMCVATAPSRYGVADELPDPTWLSWWTSKQCSITEPGVYKVDTQWKLDTWPVTRTVHVLSNTFVAAAE